jgi:hypothetical protein
MVPRIVSINQPRTVLSVDQHASPLSIFFTEAGSWRVMGSVEFSGRKTSSKAPKRMRRTRPRRAGEPCAAERASSTKTSKYCNGWRRRLRAVDEGALRVTGVTAGGAVERVRRRREGALRGTDWTEEAVKWAPRRKGGSLLGVRGTAGDGVELA